MVFEPPKRLVRALGETAPEGDDWLEKLPDAVQQAVALRELTVERVQVPGGRSSLVVLVTGSQRDPALLRTSGAEFPADALRVLVRVDLGEPSAITTVSGFRPVVLGRLDDLSSLLTSAGVAA